MAGVGVLGVPKSRSPSERCAAAGKASSAGMGCRRKPRLPSISPSSSP